MAITFNCPNGHKLSCPDDRAGRGGKCPKCGAAFRVPGSMGSGLTASDSNISDSQITEPPADDPPKVEPALAAAAEAATSAPSVATAPQPPAQPDKTAANGAKPASDNIVFLCPNGHKLNGPASLQGRPGKCPHCGATFLIPDYNEIPSEEGQQFLESLEDELFEEDEEEEEPARRDDRGAFLNGDDLPFNFAGLDGDNAAAYSDHAMARLFNHLWSSRGTGIIEIYLKGGNVVSPDWFAPDHSLESCGMFGLQDADGSYTLTAIRWDAMERISVRGLEDFPDGMFR